MARQRKAPRVPKKAPVRTLSVRSIKMVFNVEESVDGILQKTQEVPAVVYEAQFNSTLASLATALLEQANGSPEPTAKGEDKKVD